jgi:hypothetical protein
MLCPLAAIIHLLRGSPINRQQRIDARQFLMAVHLVMRGALV